MGRKNGIADNLVRLGLALAVIVVITMTLHQFGSRGASAWQPPTSALIKR